MDAKSRLPTDSEESILSRVILSGALSLALHPPGEENLQKLRREAARGSIRAAGQFLAQEWRNGSDGSKDGQSPNLLASLEAWEQALSGLRPGALQSRFAHLFGHVTRGPVCPYEAEYGQDGLFQQPQHLASLNGLYRAFGLKVRSQERERPDHVSAELEFLEFLVRKQWYARSQGQPSMEQATRQAIRLFLKHHLGRFGRAFGRRLQDQDPGGFLGCSGALLFEFLTLECRRFAIKPGALSLALRPVAEDRIPMACSQESDLVQIET